MLCLGKDTQIISAHSKRWQYRIAAFFFPVQFHVWAIQFFQAMYLYLRGKNKTMKIFYESAALFHWYASLL